MNRRTKQDYFLYDEINDKAFRDLSILVEKDEDVCIHVSSHGGGIFDAIAIYNMICNNRKKTTVVIDGIAAGAASFFFLGAGDVVMDRNAYIILAEPRIVSTAESLEKDSKEIESLKREMVNIYEKHTKLTRVEILELMKSQNPIGFDAALKYGFVRDEL